MTAKIHRFWLTVPSGLEEVALDELREKSPQSVSVEPGGRTGQIFFTFKRSPKNLQDLRAATHLAGLVVEMHRVTVGRPGLDHICARIAKADFNAVKSLARSHGGDIQADRFSLSATLHGRYRFGHAEVVGAVSRVLREVHGLREGQGGQGLRLHLQLSGRRGLLGLRLGAASAPGAATAYCLARLLGMQTGDRVLWARRDRSELAALSLYCSPQALVGIADRWAAPTGVQAGLIVAGPGAYPLKSGRFDYVLRHIGGDFHAELAELARILRFGGVGLVQVGPVDLFFDSMDEGDYPFAVLANLRLQERGRPYGLLVLERLEEYDPGLIQVAWDL